MFLLAFNREAERLCRRFQVGAGLADVRVAEQVARLDQRRAAFKHAASDALGSLIEVLADDVPDLARERPIRFAGEGAYTVSLRPRQADRPDLRFASGIESSAGHHSPPAWSRKHKRRTPSVT
jgi:hypothetical protein